MVSINHYIYTDRTFDAKCHALSQRFRSDKQLQELNKIGVCSLVFKPVHEMHDHLLSITYYEKLDRLSPIIDHFLDPLFGEDKIQFTRHIGRHYYPELRMALRKDALDRLNWDGIFYLSKTILLAASNELQFSKKTSFPKF